METRTSTNVAASRWAGVALAMALVPLAVMFSAKGPAEYSEWSTPVNLGPPVNTLLAEIGPFLTKDGLSLYFVRGAGAGGFGGMDIWVSQRGDASESWGPPHNLGPTINSPFNEFAPSLTLDGHSLYFASNRPGGFGGIDLYVSRRHNKRDDFGWQPPANLGSGINTAANELQSVYHEDDVTGITTLYFASNRPEGIGGDDLYASTLLVDETFGPAHLVEELSTPFSDIQPAIRRDGLEMFLTSNRPGTLGLLDLWVSTRASTSEPWSTPMNLGLGVNTVTDDVRAALSFDAIELYFQSNRPGGVGSQDFWRSTRGKLKEPD